MKNYLIIFIITSKIVIHIVASTLLLLLIYRSLLHKIPQWNTAAHLADPPTIEEVARAISQMSSNKSHGAASVPAEIYKHEGENLTNHLYQLITKTWSEECPA